MLPRSRGAGRRVTQGSRRWGVHPPGVVTGREANRLHPIVVACGRYSRVARPPQPLHDVTGGDGNRAVLGATAQRGRCGRTGHSHRQASHWPDDPDRNPAARASGRRNISCRCWGWGRRLRRWRTDPPGPTQSTTGQPSVQNAHRRHGVITPPPKPAPATAGSGATGSTGPSVSGDKPDQAAPRAVPPAARDPAAVGLGSTSGGGGSNTTTTTPQATPGPSGAPSTGTATTFLCCPLHRRPVDTRRRGTGHIHSGRVQAAVAGAPDCPAEHRAREPRNVHHREPDAEPTVAQPAGRRPGCRGGADGVAESRGGRQPSASSTDTPASARGRSSPTRMLTTWTLTCWNKLPGHEGNEGHRRAWFL